MKNQDNKKSKRLVIIAAVCLVLVIGAFSIPLPGKEDNLPQKDSGIEVAKDTDIVIPVNSVTDVAAFYPAEINGTKLEVIAVKASDGSIRTAFNTCQVCFSSGRGYYKQEGSNLICQNCGNRFRMDEVEVTRGGCNPVPITSEYKEVSEDTITISKDFLEQATVIFQNWK